MSGTINSTLTFAVVNGTYTDNPTIQAENLVQTTEGGGNPGYVNVGTSEEDISFGDVTPGMVIIENLDATNYVTYGPKSGGSMILFGKIPAGGVHKMQLGAAVTLRMKADTAAVNLRIRGYNA